MTTVLMVDPTYVSGGICHYTFGLCNALAERGLRVFLATLDAPYELESLPRQFEVCPILVSQSRAARVTARILPGYSHAGRLLARFVRRIGAHVIHSQHFRSPEMWAAMRRGAPNVPFVLTVHDIGAHTAQLCDGDKMRLSGELSHADQVIVHSEDFFEKTVNFLGVAPDRLHKIRPGNYQFLAQGFPPPANVRSRLKIDEQDHVILAFGYIVPYKGLDVLLLAVKAMLERDPTRRLTVLIVGSVGWQKTETWEDSVYCGLARSLNIENVLRVIPHYVKIEDIGQYFSAADVVCCPYREGASPSAVVQLAYAYERPVVASDVRALQELVIDGYTGHRVPINDPTALADVLSEVFDQAGVCRRLGEQASRWSQQEFSWTSIAEQTSAIYAKGFKSARPVASTIASSQIEERY